MLAVALQAAEKLAQSGVLCRVLHYHSARPFDVSPLVLAAKETGGIVTLEEHSVSGGFGGLVAEELMEAGGRPALFYRMGLRGGFSSMVGSQEYLRKQYGLDADSVQAKVLDLLAVTRKLGKGLTKVASQ
jgi:transketolase